MKDPFINVVVLQFQFVMVAAQLKQNGNKTEIKHESENAKTAVKSFNYFINDVFHIDCAQKRFSVLFHVLYYERNKTISVDSKRNLWLPCYFTLRKSAPVFDHVCLQPKAQRQHQPRAEFYILFVFRLYILFLFSITCILCFLKLNWISLI